MLPPSSHTFLSKKLVKSLSFRYFRTCYVRVSIHSKVWNVCIYMVLCRSHSKVIEILDGLRRGSTPNKGSCNEDQKADDDAAQDARTIRWIHLGLDCAIVDPHSASSFVYRGEFSAQKNQGYYFMGREMSLTTWEFFSRMNSGEKKCTSLDDFNMTRRNKVLLQ